MRMVGHRTQSIYSRYAIVSDSDLKEAAAKLDASVIQQSSPTITLVSRCWFLTWTGPCSLAKFALNLLRFLRWAGAESNCRHEDFQLYWLLSARVQKLVNR
jgi:hypothetical protein